MILFTEFTTADEITKQCSANIASISCCFIKYLHVLPPRLVQVEDGRKVISGCNGENQSHRE